jgi:transcriptional regulator with XRE-family HTH domain
MLSSDMRLSELLREARHRAGMSQRALAERAGVPQSTVARIERRTIDPKTATLERLLRACDIEVALTPRLGQGIDRSQIRERLARSPRQRIDDASVAGDQVRRLRRARRVD